MYASALFLPRGQLTSSCSHISFTRLVESSKQQNALHNLIPSTAVKDTEVDINLTLLYWTVVAIIVCKILRVLGTVVSVWLLVVKGRGLSPFNHAQSMDITDHSMTFEVSILIFQTFPIQRRNHEVRYIPLSYQTPRRIEHAQCLV